MEKFMERLEEWMELRGLTPQSRRMFRWVAQDFLSFCKENNRRVGKEAVIDYLLSLNVSQGHRKWRYQMLKVIFEKAWDLEWFKGAEEAKVRPKGPSEEPNRPVITLDQFQRLYEAADKPWMKIALRIAAETGARRLQIAKLLRKHFDPKKKTLTIPPIKRSPLVRVEIISNQLTQLIKKYLKRRKDRDPHLLLDEKGKPLTEDKMNSEFKRLKKMAGLNIKGLGWHSLRRSWTTWLYQKGMSELEIQRAGGWMSPTMVSIYVRLSPTKVVEKEAKLHPLKE